MSYVEVVRDGETQPDHTKHYFLFVQLPISVSITVSCVDTSTKGWIRKLCGLVYRIQKFATATMTKCRSTFVDFSWCTNVLTAASLYVLDTTLY